MSLPPSGLKEPQTTNGKEHAGFLLGSLFKTEFGLIHGIHGVIFQK
jgi:hypothetical protein